MFKIDTNVCPSQKKRCVENQPSQNGYENEESRASLSKQVHGFLLPLVRLASKAIYVSSDTKLYGFLVVKDGVSRGLMQGELMLNILEFQPTTPSSS